MEKKALFKVIVPLILLGVVFAFSDMSQVITLLQQLDLLWLGAAILSLTALTALMARRWQLIAHAFDLELPYGRALREYYLAQLWNLLLPGGVAGDAARAVRLRHQGDLKRAAQSVAQERLLGQVALTTVLCVGLLGAAILPGGLPWPAFTGWVVLAGFALATAIVILMPGDGFTAKFLQQTRKLALMPVQIGLSAIITALLIFSFYACAAATGTHIPVAGLTTVIPLILSAMIIPLSIGGWGWREGAAAALFPIIGASASAGVATGITYGIAMLIAAAPAVVFLFIYPTSPLAAAQPTAES